MTTTKQDLNLHRGLKDCNWTEAPCHVCLDLNRLLCAPPEVGRYSYQIETSLEDLSRSKEMGCPTCSILFTGILSFLDFSNVVIENNITKFPIGQVEIDLRSQHVVHLKIWKYDVLRYHVQTLHAMLDFHSSREVPSPWEAFGRGNFMPSQLTVEDCAEFAKTRLQKCDTEHKNCVLPPASVFSPTRLLDLLSDSHQIEKVKLVQDTPRASPYVALSYCWGSELHLRTTKANLSVFLNGIPFSSLPLRFQDAIRMIQRLGIRYLWIDALCIVQDDVEDWETEAKQMGKIYACSYLTIAMTHSANNLSGFVPPRAPELLKPPIPFTNHPITGDFEGRPFCILVHQTPITAHSDLTSDFCPLSPLLKRGWAFQERMLSRRVLHLHTEELVWECNTLVDCECGSFVSDYPWEEMISPKIVISQTRNNSATSEAKPILWQDIIERYCRLNFTRESDRLPALSGIAERFLELLPSEFGNQPEGKLERYYLAGMWRDTLLHDLLWFPGDTSLRLSPPCAPTWSWASMEAPKSLYGNRHRVIIDSRLEIVDAYCHLISSNRFGHVSGGLLCLEAAFLSTKFTDGQFLPESQCGDGLSFLYLDMSPDLQGIVPGDELYVVYIGERVPLGNLAHDAHYFIVLQSLKDLFGTYRRVGVLHIVASRHRWVDDMPVQVFNIV